MGTYNTYGLAAEAIMPCHVRCKQLGRQQKLNGLHRFPMQPAVSILWFVVPFSLFPSYFTTLWNNCDLSRLLKSESDAAKWTASLPEFELTSVPDRAAFSVSDPLILR
jgi:hypothetical protein